MKILIDIVHPVGVNFYRNAAEHGFSDENTEKIYI